MFLQGQICVSVRVGQSFTKCLCSVTYTVRSILVEKRISPVIFDTDHSFKWQSALCLTKKIVYQSFYSAPLTLSYFLLQGKVLFSMLRCFGKSLASCIFQSIPKTLPKKLFLGLNI